MKIAGSTRSGLTAKKDFDFLVLSLFAEKRIDIMRGY